MNFQPWCTQQVQAGTLRGPQGHFAYDVHADAQFPAKLKTLGYLLTYLKKAQANAHCIATAMTVWQRYADEDGSMVIQCVGGPYDGQRVYTELREPVGEIHIAGQQGQRIDPADAWKHAGRLHSYRLSTAGGKRRYEYAAREAAS
jgi:hypothetical protein